MASPICCNIYKDIADLDHSVVMFLLGNGQQLLQSDGCMLRTYSAEHLLDIKPAQPQQLQS
jgi:hypothetical protein